MRNNVSGVYVNMYTYISVGCICLHIYAFIYTICVTCNTNIRTENNRKCFMENDSARFILEERRRPYCTPAVSQPSRSSDARPTAIAVIIFKAF